MNANITLEMTDSMGRLLYGLKFEDTLGTYRAAFYPVLPFENARITLRLCVRNGVRYLDAGKGHSNIRWSTGDTTQTIAITEARSYFAYVNFGEGMLRSNVFVAKRLPVSKGDKRKQINQE